MVGHTPAVGRSSSGSRGAAALRLSVVVPTRNEAGNLLRLKQELEVALAGVSHEVIVVDDSTDHETRPLLRELASRSDRWRVIERPSTQQTGLATAVTDGMGVARGVETLAGSAAGEAMTTAGGGATTAAARP